MTNGLMEQKKDAFIFDTYYILPNKKEIVFNYKYKDLKFTEKIILLKQIPITINEELLTKVLANIHLILGISYYKIHCAKQITIPYLLNYEQANFWNTVYTKGLGEFFYKNKVDFRNLIHFPYSKKTVSSSIEYKRKKRSLIGIGGGKDSIVSAELLKEKKKEIIGLILATGNSEIQEEIAKTAEIDYFLVKRELDEKLFSLNNILKGHIPFSAVFAFVGLLISLIYDYSEIITSNEKSSNFGNLNYLGSEINHQWSKSEEFENLFNNYVSKFITPDIVYFSLLRNYSELEITEMFVKNKKYFTVFSSCNKNFSIKSKTTKKWCGECPKCAFVFIMLAAFLTKQEVITIFDKNMLDDESLIHLYLDLLGQGEMKPFDCVGTFDESIEAFKAIKTKGEFNESKVIRSIPI